MAHHADDSYYVPHGTKWPIIGSLAMITMMASAAFWVNESEIAPWTFLVGIAILVFMLFGWFGEVIRESESGLYNAQVDTSFRISSPLLGGDVIVSTSIGMQSSGAG